MHHLKHFLNVLPQIYTNILHHIPHPISMVNSVETLDLILLSTYFFGLPRSPFFLHHSSGHSLVLSVFLSVLLIICFSTAEVMSDSSVVSAASRTRPTPEEDLREPLYVQSLHSPANKGLEPECKFSNDAHLMGFSRPSCCPSPAL